MPSPSPFIFRVPAPIARPTFAAFSLFRVVCHRNDLLLPLVMTPNDAVRAPPVGVTVPREDGAGDRGTSWRTACSRRLPN